MHGVGCQAGGEGAAAGVQAWGRTHASGFERGCGRGHRSEGVGMQGRAVGLTSSSRRRKRQRQRRRRRQRQRRRLRQRSQFVSGLGLGLCQLPGQGAVLPQGPQLKLDLGGPQPLVLRGACRAGVTGWGGQGGRGVMALDPHLQLGLASPQQLCIPAACRGVGVTRVCRGRGDAQLPVGCRAGVAGRGPVVGSPSKDRKSVV